METLSVTPKEAFRAIGVGQAKGLESYTSRIAVGDRGIPRPPDTARTTLAAALDGSSTKLPLGDAATFHCRHGTSNRRGTELGDGVVSPRRRRGAAPSTYAKANRARGPSVKDNRGACGSNCSRSGVLRSKPHGEVFQKFAWPNPPRGPDRSAQIADKSCLIYVGFRRSEIGTSTPTAHPET